MTGSPDCWLCHTDPSTSCRSVSMDAWSPEQLKRMQLGGNDALNVFLKNYGIDKYTDIRDKYNSQAAEVRLFNQHCHWTAMDCANNPLAHPAAAARPTVHAETCMYATVLQRQNQGRNRGKELCAPSAFSVQQQLKPATSRR